MPDPLEFPGMLRTVIPLVSRKRLSGSIIDELVAFAFGHLSRFQLGPAIRRLPRLAAIIRALDDLSEPAAGLRCIQPVGVCRRTFHMVDLPSAKMRAADLPLFAFSIRSKNKCAFTRAHQYSCLAHPLCFSL